MRKNSWLIAFTLCFFSCADRAVQERLERADSLMWNAPDSAYRVLQGIDRRRLSTEGQRAYYGLLYTQAQYKNFEPLTSDSLILRSSLYYDGRDETRHGLALYYLGTVYQDKEFYDLAIEQYKHALEHLSPADDPKIVAMVYNNVGSVYRSQYFGKESVAAYRKALRLFELLGDTLSMSYTYRMMGGSYRMEDKIDSALWSYSRSFELAQLLGDSVKMGDIQRQVALTYLEEGDLERAKKSLCTSTSYDVSLIGSWRYWRLRADIALKEDNLDSALYFLARCRDNDLVVDKTRSLIYHAQGRYREAWEVSQSYFQKASEAWARRDSIRIDEIAAKYDQQRILQEKEALNRALWIWIGVGCALLLLLGATVVLFAYRRKQHRTEANNLRETLHTFEKEARHLKHTYGQLTLFLEKRLALLSEWAELSGLETNNEKVFVRRMRALIEQHPLDQNEAEAIVSAVNTQSDGLISYLGARFPKLNESELLVCALTYMGYSSHQVYAILSARSVQTIYDKKHKIVRKMESSGDLKGALDRIATDFRSERAAF